jgi:hypothetical protein
MNELGPDVALTGVSLASLPSPVLLLTIFLI